MLNGISKEERLERTRQGIYNQIKDFTFIIDEYIDRLNEEELIGLYELKEDLEI